MDLQLAGKVAVVTGASKGIGLAITPARTAHGYEVLGDEPARVVCIDSPALPTPES